MAHDVFISYASKDRAWADAVCATLEANGISCWMAPRDIPEGTDYPAALTAALRVGRALVLIYSAASNDSLRVQREVERTLSYRIPIIPFRIENVPLSPGMEYLISTPQWLDATSAAPEKPLAALVLAVQRLLASATTDLDKVIIPRLPKLLYAQRRLRWMLLALAVAMAMAILSIGAGTYYYFSRTDALAVLPFDSDSRDKTLDYLSTEVPAEIIRSLSALSHLEVKPIPQNLRRLKAQKIEPHKAADDLHVRKVLIGAITRQSKSLSITADLVEPFTASTLGSYRNPEGEGLLGLRKAILEGIMEKLQMWLSRREKEKVLKPPTENKQAYELYLQAREQWNRRDEEGFHKAVGLYEDAIKLDPRFALAYAGIADCYNLLADYSVVPPGDRRAGFPAALEAAEKAVTLDPNLSEGHTSKAFALYQYRWDWNEAEKEFRNALTLNPHYATALQWYAVYLTVLGRHKESIAQMAQAVDLDPTAPILRTNLGWLYHLARQDDKAFEQLQLVLKDHPEFEEAHRQLGDVYLQRKQYANALAEYQKAQTQSREDVEYQSLIGRAQAFLGQRREALQALQALERRPAEKYTPASYIALIYIALGDRDRAFDWLDRAIIDRSDEMTLLQVDPAYDSLRNDSRFAELLKRVGLPD